jgi:hypothetical protein
MGSPAWVPRVEEVAVKRLAVRPAVPRWRNPTRLRRCRARCLRAQRPSPQPMSTRRPLLGEVLAIRRRQSYERPRRVEPEGDGATSATTAFFDDQFAC